MLYCKWKDTFCKFVDDESGTCSLWYGCKYDQREVEPDYREDEEEF